MTDEIQIIDTTQSAGYDIILGQLESTEELVILLQDDESKYADNLTHVYIKVKFLKRDQLFRTSSSSSIGGCHICNSFDEVENVSGFVVLNEGKIPIIKHLQICNSCSEILEQQVKLAIENDFIEKITSRYI